MIVMLAALMAGASCAACCAGNYRQLVVDHVRAMVAKVEFATHWRQAGWDTGLSAGDYAETGFNSNQVSPDITAEREWKR